MRNSLDIRINSIFTPLMLNQCTRYGFYGGRCSGKSYAIAHYAIKSAMERSENIFTIRKTQTSLRYSSFAIYKDIINQLNLASLFKVYHNHIVYTCGNVHSEFHFKGLDVHSDSLRSAHNVTLTIVEEAQDIARGKIEDLINTVLRTPISRIVCIWNPKLPINAVDEYFRGSTPPPDSYIAKVNYLDNNYMPPALIAEAENLKATNIDKYNHIWLGDYLSMSDAQIFKNTSIEVLEVPKDLEPLIGVDFGFNDPNTVVVCYVLPGNVLYIAREVYVRGDMDIFHKHLLSVLINYPVDIMLVCDCADPGRIFELKKLGLNAVGVKKPPGSINAGIAWLQTKKIVINPNCINMIKEAQSYCWEADADGNFIDKPMGTYNHLWDALRYATTSERLKLSNLEVLSIN